VSLGKQFPAFRRNLVALEQRKYWFNDTSHRRTLESSAALLLEPSASCNLLLTLVKLNAVRIQPIVFEDVRHTNWHLCTKLCRGIPMNCRTALLHPALNFLPFSVFCFPLQSSKLTLSLRKLSFCGRTVSSEIYALRGYYTALVILYQLFGTRYLSLL
jgi:hypothetical protein